MKLSPFHPPEFESCNEDQKKQISPILKMIKIEADSLHKPTINQLFQTLVFIPIFAKGL